MTKPPLAYRIVGCIGWLVATTADAWNSDRNLPVVTRCSDGTAGWSSEQSPHSAPSQLSLELLQRMAGLSGSRWTVRYRRPAFQVREGSASDSLCSWRCCPRPAGSRCGACSDPDGLRRTLLMPATATRMWRASNMDEAIAKAEDEAHDYAATIDEAPASTSV